MWKRGWIHTTHNFATDLIHLIQTSTMAIGPACVATTIIIISRWLKLKQLRKCKCSHHILNFKMLPLWGSRARCFSFTSLSWCENRTEPSVLFWACWRTVKGQHLLDDANHGVKISWSKQQQQLTFWMNCALDKTVAHSYLCSFLPFYTHIFSPFLLMSWATGESPVLPSSIGNGIAFTLEFANYLVSAFRGTWTEGFL